METMGQRLKWARERAHFRSARAAAIDNGWIEVTYRSHETGLREFDFETAGRYGRAFKVDPLWLLHGAGTPKRDAVTIVGLAGAGPDGSVLFSMGDGDLGEAPMPPGATENTVAVEVRGDSMRGVAENGWLIYYDDRRNPPTDDILGEVCVVGLVDGRVLVKKLIRGRRKGHYDLESVTAPTMHDVKVEWAALVTAIVPRSTARRLGARNRP